MSSFLQKADSSVDEGLKLRKAYFDVVDKWCPEYKARIQKHINRQATNQPAKRGRKKRSLPQVTTPTRAKRCLV